MDREQRIENIMIDHLQGIIGGYYNWTLGDTCKDNDELRKQQSFGFLVQTITCLQLMSKLFGWTEKDSLEICFTQRQELWWMNSQQKAEIRQALEEKLSRR